MVAVDEVTLECPNCHWIFKAKGPDRRHSVASLEEPQKSKVAGDVLEENHVCRNPKCKEAFTVYWFEPVHFLRRI